VAQIFSTNRSFTDYCLSLTDLTGDQAPEVSWHGAGSRAACPLIFTNPNLNCGPVLYFLRAARRVLPQHGPIVALATLFTDRNVAGDAGPLGSS
jgi:hypothetical protein